MQKKKIAFVKFIKLLLKVGVMCAYFGLIVVLMMQALTPGEKSSNISNSVGDKIDQIVLNNVINIFKENDYGNVLHRTFTHL